MTATRSPAASHLAQFRSDVIAGLTRPRKRLPAKYFYDATGSRLFDGITTLDEYYLTRTELAIINRHASGMAQCLGPGCLLIELGGGSLRKVRLLLDHLESPAGYIPVDVSADHLRRATDQLKREYPQLDVTPLIADFTRPLRLPHFAPKPVRRAVYFPGSTLGNFDPADARRLLRRMARLAGPGGAVLLGVDLQKDPQVLQAAYNDSQGLTAAFNLNILARINRELGADFELSKFRHHAWYNHLRARIEMHLRSTADQQVRLAGQLLHFRRGETIHTENSYKYDLHQLGRQVARCGLRVEKSYTDELQYFGVLYLTCPP